MKQRVCFSTITLRQVNHYAIHCRSVNNNISNNKQMNRFFVSPVVIVHHPRQEVLVAVYKVPCSPTLDGKNIEL